jgi:hypothetical protein
MKEVILKVFSRQKFIKRKVKINRFIIYSVFIV